MWVQMGFRRFRPNEGFFLAILLLWYSSCSKCLFVLARVLTLTLLLGGFRWNITCHGMAQTCWKIVWTTHSAMEDLWISYTYIYILFIYIYDYLFIFVPIPPVWAIPTHSKTRSMQWSLRCSVLLLRNLCAAADGCWAECGRSGYYGPEFCCQPTDGGNPSCWDEAGIYTFSKCHWV